MQILESLDEAIRGARRGEQSMVKCEAHEDNHASVHVAPGNVQPVLITCHAGCSLDSILRASNVDLQAILMEQDENATRRPGDGMWTPAGTASHVYPYTDEDGVVLYEVMRIPLPDSGKKTFRQRRPNPKIPGRYLWSLGDTRRVLYHLPEVLRGITEGRRIWVVEGEKDVESLRKVGEIATTSPMGAGKWSVEFSKTLKGANVAIISDADATGRAHARHVRDELTEYECAVTVYEAAHGKDVTDHLDSGLLLEHLIETVPEDQEVNESYGIDVMDAIQREFQEKSFVIPGTLAQGDRLLITGFEGHGKQAKLSTPLWTTDGWTTMGDIRVGQQVPDINGVLCNVVAKSEIDYEEQAYIVKFHDGSEMEVGERHQWITWTLEAREASARRRKKLAAGGSDYIPKHLPSTVTTAHIRDTLMARDGHVKNHAIRVAGALELPEVALPFPAYTLGAWLGDGTTAGGHFTLGARDVAITDGLDADDLEWHYVNRDSRPDIRYVRLHGGTSALREIGVLGNKHIPEQYLRGSIEQRKALLAGLCDTDGYCDPRGTDVKGRGAGATEVEYSTVSESIADGVVELLRGLGVNPRVYKGEAKLEGRVTGPKWRIIFQSDFNPFRHAGFKRDRWRPLQTERALYRYIESVEPVQNTGMQCIQVDSPSRTYLAGKELIPTHNSTLLRQLAVQTAAGIHPWTGAKTEPKKVLVIDCENHPDQTLTSWQDLVGLCARHNAPMQRGQLTILEQWDSGVNLTGEDGAAWINERIHAYKPDLIVMGPLYNMSDRDLKDDETVRKIKKVVNEARSICGTAFIMEHHAPHKGQNDSTRSVRPYGSSTFLKWPDFGYGINPTETEGVYEWQKTRFPRVRSRNFPDHVRWGKPNTDEFPWVVAQEDANGNFH